MKAFAVLAGLCALVPTVLAGGLMRSEKPGSTSSTLQVALTKALQGEAVQRLIEVEQGVRPNFEAFPKNSAGHIPTVEIFPAIVRSFFAKEHGWLIKGLEPPSWQAVATKVEEIAILRERAPDVAAALAEISRSGRGLSMSDIVGTIAALEHLIIEEGMHFLDEAYSLCGARAEDRVHEAKALDILRSYLLLYRYGAPEGGKVWVKEKFDIMKMDAAEAADWPALSSFVQNSLRAARLGDHGAASEAGYDRGTLKAAVRDMAVSYGKLQNAECEDMKETLVGLARDERSGLVPFPAFQNEPNHAAYQFTETAEYLEKTGILVKTGRASNDAEVQVRIANYVLGPSNCIAPNEYYMICCLSECEDVVSAIETRTQAPVLAAEQLLSIVQDLGTSTVQAPHAVSEVVANSLHAIGAHYEGLVPLHSAEFRQWLNAAFPNECPYLTPPEVAAQEMELRVASQWLKGQRVCTRLPEWHPQIVAAVGHIGEVELEVEVAV